MQERQARAEAEQRLSVALGEVGGRAAVPPQAVHAVHEVGYPSSSAGDEVRSPGGLAGISVIRTALAAHIWVLNATSMRNKHYPKGIMLDSGAAVSVCPVEYFPEYGIQSGRRIVLQAVDGSPVEHYGSRDVFYMVGSEAMKVRFEVTSVKAPILCLAALEDVFSCIVLSLLFRLLFSLFLCLSFLESLDSEHASSATSVKVKVPAMLIDAISFEESAATLTLTWSKNTRKVQVQGPWQCWTEPRSSRLNSSKLIVRTVSQGRFSLHRRVASVRLQCCGVLRRVITWSLSKMDQSQIGNVRPLCLRILHSEQSSHRSLQVGRVSLIGGQSGRVNLLSSWFMNWVLTRKLWESLT